MIAAEGAELHTEEHGEGEPLLLVAGLGGSTWTFHRQIALFARTRRVIAYDPRGSGLSSKPAGPYTAELLAGDAAAVLAAHGVVFADVLGLSLGGMVAQTLALRRPELVRKLVLASTAAGGSSFTPAPDETRTGWTRAATLPPEEAVWAGSEPSFAPGWLAGQPELVAELVALRIEHPQPPETWHAQFAASVQFLQDDPPVETIAAPTLVIHGDADRVLPVENGYALAERIRHAELVILPARGHLALIEEPQAFHAPVEEFLSRAS